MNKNTHMKKVLFWLMALALTVGNAKAIGKQFDSERYEVIPTSVSTDGFEFGISFFRDNTVVFFQADESVTELNDRRMPRTGINIFKATLTEDGNLENPVLAQELMDLGVSGTFAYDSERDKIFFTRFNTTNRVFQLFESYFENGAWTAPQVVVIEGLTPTRRNMSTIVNANWDYLDRGASIINPALAKNGTRLFFASNMRGGEGRMDIWFSDFDTEADVWGAPVNLRGINTSGSEQFPFPVGDSILYFASNSSSHGGFDLFVARLAEDIDNLEQENLGPILNSARNESNLITDGRRFLFIADRQDTNDDIMFVRGFPLLDLEEIAMVEPLPVEEIRGFNYVLFLFDFDRANLRTEFMAQLDMIVEEMNMFPEQRFLIAGHADVRGSYAHNERLSMRRARTVQNLLVQRGIDRDRLVLRAYGETNLLIENAQTEEEHAMNRRVEITIYN